MITIAIVNYNTTDHLDPCLAALRQAVTVPYEVVVVDNASTDGNVRAVADAHPEMRLIVNSVNRFYSPAANQAWRAGIGDVVLFLGTDVRVESGALEAMAAVLRNPDYGAVTCRLMTPDGDTESGARAERTPAVFFYNFTFLGRLRRARTDAMNAAHEYRGWDRRSDRDVRSCSGSCLMVRRDVLERLGGYDERYKLYFLEDDLCLKMRRAGLRIRFVGTSHNIHMRHVSVRRANEARIRQLWRQDAQTYARLHFSGGTAAAIAAAMAATGALRLLQGALARLRLVRSPRSWWQDRRATAKTGEPC